MKKHSVSLIALNPQGEHSINIHLLKLYAEKDPQISEYAEIKLHFFDCLIPAQSNGTQYILKKILDDKSDMIGFSCYCWNIEEVLRLVNLIKLINPQKEIFLGGPEASCNAKHILSTEKNVDMIIKGEGEESFKKLMLYKIGILKDLNEVENLIFRREKEIIQNKESYISNLKEVPPIFANNSIDIKKFGENLYCFETKRGCHYHCSYCFHHKGSHEIREYPMEYVKKELDALLSSDLKYIWIVDPCFNDNEERSLEIIQYIVENNHKDIAFGFEVRNETLTEKFIQEMSKLKTIRFVAMGLQTVNKNALKAVNRALDIPKFEQNFELIKKHFSNEIRIHIDLIYGLPFDNLEGYKESIDYALGLGGIIFTQPLKILKGTKLFIDADKYGIVYNPESPHEVLYNDTFSYEDMCGAEKINAALSLYQCNSDIKSWIEHVARQCNIRISEVFQEVAESLWNKEYDSFFQNYREFSLGYLMEVVGGILKDSYGITFEIPEHVNKEEKVQLYWGSVAKQEFYK